MSLALAVQNLGGACAQGLLVAGAAAVLARLFPLERPRLMLRWWQAVLLAVLALPALQPWAPGASARVEVSWLRIGPALGEPGTAFGRWAWAEVIVAFLAAGALARLAWLALGLGHLRALCRRATPLEPSGPALAGLEGALGTRAAFLLSDEVGGPATFGLLRPVVLLPRAWLAMEADRQRAVATHELLHVRRHDWLHTLLEEALACALWFHPAVHFLLGRVRLAREQCVDEAVVRALGRRQAYLESLLEMARHTLRRRAFPAALLLRERHLRDRVELLLKEVTMSQVRTLCHLALSASFLVLTGALAASSFPLAGGEGARTAAEKPKGGEKAGKAVKEPRLVHKVQPSYPAEAKKEGLEGIVLIDVRVGKDGAVADARVTRGHPVLAEAALAAVRQWRYQPTLGPDKKPVEVTLTITINFRLA